MKKIQQLGCYLLCLVVLSSNQLFAYGLDIYETCHVHSKGSGQFEIAADLTRAEQLIKIASLFANVTPEVAQKSIQGALSEAANSLQGVLGISNVATAHDAKMLHFKLSFQFNSIKALNSAMQKLHTHAGHPGHTYFKMNHGAFVRVDTQSIAQLLTHYHAQVDLPIANLNLKTFSNIVTYHLTYRFDKKIKNTTHTLATISEDRFTLFLKQPLFDESERELSLNNKITF
jgi:hypothetical protein